MRWKHDDHLKTQLALSFLCSKKVPDCFSLPMQTPLQQAVKPRLTESQRLRDSSG